MRERFDNGVRKQQNGGSPYFPDWEQVFKFLKSEVSRAVREREEEIVELLKEKMIEEVDQENRAINLPNKHYHKGKMHILEDIISLINSRGDGK